MPLTFQMEKLKMPPVTNLYKGAEAVPSVYSEFKCTFLVPLS